MHLTCKSVKLTYRYITIMNQKCHKISSPKQLNWFALMRCYYNQLYVAPPIVRVHFEFTNKSKRKSVSATFKELIKPGHHIAQTTAFLFTSVGEKAKNMRAAIIPTGKKRSINGGGGSGGNNNGSNTIDAASPASTKPRPKLKQFTILTNLVGALTICL